jgi:putative ABC transport system permease protein
MNFLAQIVTVTALNLRNIRERLGASASAAFGVAGVVAVFVAVLSIAEGFKAAMTTAGSADTAVVLRAGANTEMTSGLTRDDTRIIMDMPGISRGAAGPVAAAELFVVVDVPKRSTKTDANVPLRGVQPSTFQVRPEVKIVQGRRFEPGRNEIIVGRAAADLFDGLSLGSTKTWGQNQWTVVGIFEAGGALWESEVWTDAAVLQSAYRRGDTFQVVYAKLASAEAFDGFKDALTTDPRLNIKVVRETDFFAEQSVAIQRLIRGLGMFIAALMGIGAVFGALNTMYAAVSSRTREIATLRAIGFGAGPVVISVLAEATLLALTGGVLGAALAYLAFNGFKTSTMNWESFSQVAFAFRVTPGLLAQGILYAVLVGLAGGLFPAFRAARLPIATGLREL